MYEFSVVVFDDKGVVSIKNVVILMVSDVGLVN